MPISTISDALTAFEAGEFLIVIDNPSRENEGDLIISAAHLTPRKMAFMIRHTSGLICVPMSESRLLELGLPDMVERNEESLKTAYTITCDSRLGITTGISATDRAHTCNVLASEKSTGMDLVRPGHVLPLRAREGGVLVRDGHTEAAVDLCRLAGLSECAAISEIVRDEDGEMARTEELLRLGEAWGIKVITIEDLKSHRLMLECASTKVSTTSNAIVPKDAKLLSTILYTACSFFLIDLHIERLRESTRRLAWTTPDEMEVQRKLYQAIMGRAHLTLRLRMTVARTGDIDIEVTETNAPRNLLGPFAQPGNGLQSAGPQISSTIGQSTWTVFLDRQATLTQTLLPLIENKTTSRLHYTEPLKRCGASIKDMQEVLLFNERGQVTEGTITNVIFRRNGQYITPATDSGLLNGVVRRSLIAAGKIIEETVRVEDLVDGEEVLLCNAVRGIFPAMLKLSLH